MPDPGSTPDEEAVVRTRAGDAEAFEPLLRRYAGPLAAAAYDRLGSVGDAQEAAQDALTTAYARLADLKDPARFGAWVYEILRNRCGMGFRHREVERGAVEEIRRRADKPVAGPLDLLEEEERGAQIRQAVAALTPALREAVVLRYWGGAGREEAAKMLDIGLDAFDKRMERAMEELRKRVVGCEL